MPTISYKTIPEFEHDFKKLLKKFRSLENDINTAKQNAIELYHLRHINNEAVFSIPDFCSEKLKICKLKKIACKALKGQGVKSGIRIIYAFHEETYIVVFIEIYFKGEKSQESFDRIKAYINSVNS